MSSPYPDTCRRCGARLFPVLDAGSDGPVSGPLPADSPVRMACPSCPPAEVPFL